MVKGGGVILLPCLCILIMPISVCQETCCLEILMMDLGQVSFHTPPPLPNHTKPTVSRPVKSHRYSAMSLLKVVPTS